ncbi:MAG: hypothetical protein RL088_20 [Verrucomicrobiota bacterium]|jgi:hypothetical protein
MSACQKNLAHGNARKQVTASTSGSDDYVHKLALQNRLLRARTLQTTMLGSGTVQFCSSARALGIML